MFIKLQCHFRGTSYWVGDVLDAIGELFTVDLEWGAPLLHILDLHSFDIHILHVISVYRYTFKYLFLSVANDIALETINSWVKKKKNGCVFALGPVWWLFHYL